MADEGKRHTLTVPSNVLATTILSSASLAKPVIQRSSFLFVPIGRKRLATFAGHGPTLYARRRIPDCMLYMLIVPVEDAARPKLPHADTHTACTDHVGKQANREVIVHQRTLTDPTVAPFFFSPETLNTCFPTRLSFRVHVRATASSV